MSFVRPPVVGRQLLWKEPKVGGRTPIQGLIMDLFGERESDLGVLSELERRIADAVKRYGAFASTHEALGVACEEWDELREAIRSNNLLGVRHEALDLAAVLIRLARDVYDSKQTAARSVK